MNQHDTALTASRSGAGDARPLRLGFLGLGWIGRHRMAALQAESGIEIAALADASDEAVAAAADLAPAAACTQSYAELLDMPLDGVVIATPSGQHAEQAIRALERGHAVFCQKPLGRNAPEVEAVVAAARGADRLLGVDLSYRHTAGMQWLREQQRTGVFGELIAADLVFHNAYGPDKPWFYDRRQSGGGALMDLGIHLVDLALWVTGFPAAQVAAARFYAGGKVLGADAGHIVEDFALATLTLASGATVRIAASWRAHAGAEAEISATFLGTAGGARFGNVGGSFYDFAASRFDGTHAEAVITPPDAWGGRAAVDWARRLAAGQRFDAPGGAELVATAGVLDAITAAALG